MAGVAQTGLPQHVLQRRQDDCVIATVAMVANVTYEDISERSRVRIGSRPVGLLELHRLLVTATGVPWQRPRYGWLRPVARYANISNPAVIIIRRPWRWLTLHCVALQGGWIHDPEFPRGYRPEEYPRRHWRSVTVLRPESDLCLMFVQQFRS